VTAGAAISAFATGLRITVCRSAGTAKAARLSTAAKTTITAVATRAAHDGDALNRPVSSAQIDTDGGTTREPTGSNGAGTKATTSAAAAASTVRVSTGVAAAAAGATTTATTIETQRATGAR
jgi:hypothetical protein